MLSSHLVRELENTRQYFNRSTSVLEESDSTFVPTGEIYSVAQQVAHVAQTVHWFLDGAIVGSGWNMDFASHEAETRAVTSLAVAREQLTAAFDRAVQIIGGLSDEELNAPSPADDPIMAGAPRFTAVFGATDQTAHHRGALTIYTRLLGKQPPMPYM